MTTGKRSFSKGNEGRNGGPSGDLIIYVSVAKHRVFERDGLNLYCEIPLTFSQAALGAEIDVPTLDGNAKYSIPEGTQSGTSFTLKGKGVKQVKGRQYGDIIFTVTVRTPRNLTEAQKELLRQLDGISDEDKKTHKKKK